MNYILLLAIDVPRRIVMKLLYNAIFIADLFTQTFNKIQKPQQSLFAAKTHIFVSEIQDKK